MHIKSIVAQSLPIGVVWKIRERDASSAPITADKDMLEFVQSSKNIIDADSDNESETNNENPDPPSSEMKNIIG
ncbi:hypothetical protein TNCV_4136801 [Trichonephila clavipes]|nr:hypothetical protein TNCV_4136801 [Trichonephila clavipes]